jgi:hypothetical protein
VTEAAQRLSLKPNSDASQDGTKAQEFPAEVDPALAWDQNEQSDAALMRETPYATCGKLRSAPPSFEPN